MADIRDVRDEMLSFAYEIEQQDLPSDSVLARIEDFLETLGQISALEDLDIDDGVLNCLREIEHSVQKDAQTSSTRAGRPPLDIPVDMLTTFAMAGLSTRQIADRFGVSCSTIQRRLAEDSLR